MSPKPSAKLSRMQRSADAAALERQIRKGNAHKIKEMIEGLKGDDQRELCPITGRFTLVNEEKRRRLWLTFEEARAHDLPKKYGLMRLASEDYDEGYTLERTAAARARRDRRRMARSTLPGIDGRAGLPIG